MSTVIDPAFRGTLRKYGAFDIDACFNCGSCTATCPLSVDGDSFPRRMIRFSQIGARDRLLGSKEVWLCYYCGECSDTCPRAAEPGELMAAARRYAIASADPTGLSRLLYRSRTATVVVPAVLTALLSLMLLSGAGPMAPESPRFITFQSSPGFLPFHLIHDLGVALMIFAALAMIIGVWRMARRLTRSVLPSSKDHAANTGFLSRASRAVAEVAEELAAQKRFRDCDEQPNGFWLTGKRFIHWSIMWGFLGLLLATMIDWVWGLVGIKVPAIAEPLWHPTRLLGTVAGIFLAYGTGAAIIRRFRKSEKYFSHSFLSDWMFLWLLFLGGITGFLVEITLYLPRGGMWMYVVFLLHVVLGMEIVILLPFTKFAHAVYRPAALFVHAFLRPESG